MTRDTVSRQQTEYFRLNKKEMDTIISEVSNSVSQWEIMANKIGIPRAEIQMMKSAFKY